MEEKKIGVDKIKAVLSMVSMALLSIQHFVGVFAASVSVSYIPLLITFFTIYIGTIGVDKTKAIKVVSLITTVFIALLGCILYTLQYYNIIIDEGVKKIYTKIILVCIGLLSLVLSVLHIKRICELE